MNIQRKNSAYHFRVQSERKQTLVLVLIGNIVPKNFSLVLIISSKFLWLSFGINCKT